MLVRVPYQVLPDQEGDFDRDEHVDRHTHTASGFESPLGNGQHGFFIETAAVQRLDDANLRGASVMCDDGFQDNSAFNPASERLGGISRLDLFDQKGR